MFTSLYLMSVLPASIPSAAAKTIVMVGPSLRHLCIAMPIATSAARIGMIQMTEIRVRLGGTTVACGRSPRSDGSAMRNFHAAAGIPDEPCVERLRCEHREYNDCHEEYAPQSGLHRHERVELDQ